MFYITNGDSFIERNIMGLMTYIQKSEALHKYFNDIARICESLRKRVQT